MSRADSRRPAFPRKWRGSTGHWTPPDSSFNHQNPLRIETAAQAHAIDELIVKAWAGHPRRHLVPSSADFLAKVEEALRILDGIVHAPAVPAALL